MGHTNQYLIICIRGKIDGLRIPECFVFLQIAIHPPTHILRQEVGGGNGGDSGDK